MYVNRKVLSSIASDVANPQTGGSFCDTWSYHKSSQNTVNSDATVMTWETTNLNTHTIW